MTKNSIEATRLVPAVDVPDSALVPVRYPGSPAALHPRCADPA